MESKNVPLTEIAAVVASVAEKFAGQHAPDEREALRFLAHWFDAEEAGRLLELLTSPRIRCPKCHRCVRVGAKTSGDRCLTCAILARREAESEVLQ